MPNVRKSLVQGCSRWKSDVRDGTIGSKASVSEVIGEALLASGGGSASGGRNSVSDYGASCCSQEKSDGEQHLATAGGGGGGLRVRICRLLRRGGHLRHATKNCQLPQRLWLR